MLAFVFCASVYVCCLNLNIQFQAATTTTSREIISKKIILVIVGYLISFVRSIYYQISLIILFQPYVKASLNQIYVMQFLIHVFLFACSSSCFDFFVSLSIETRLVHRSQLIDQMRGPKINLIFTIYCFINALVSIRVLRFSCDYSPFRIKNV